MEDSQLRPIRTTRARRSSSDKKTRSEGSRKSMLGRLADARRSVEIIRDYGTWLVDCQG